MTLRKFFLTFGGVGLSPKMPGTVGTLAALPVGLAILQYLGSEVLFMLALTVTIIGIFEVNKDQEESGLHDQQHIVIDEAVGIWFSLMITYESAITMHFPYVEAVAIVLSFATFRLLDIWKPSTIGWIDRELKGGMGVILDDVLAGIASGLLTVVCLMGVEKLF